MATVNSFEYEGALKFPINLKTSASGKSFLPITLQNDKSAISTVLFEETAESLARIAQQGDTIRVRGYQNQRQDQQTNYWHNTCVSTAYSADGGKTWIDQKTLRQQQHQFQQQEGQQPVNPQVEHLQQCQQQFQQQPPAPQQQAPMQQHQSQQTAPQQAPMQSQVQQAQAPSVNPHPGRTQGTPPAPQQSREQFLNSNPYQNPPPSAAAVAAQQNLYSASPVQQQLAPQAGAQDQVGQPNQQSQAAPAQQQAPAAQPPAPDKGFDDFSDEIPF